MFDGNDKTWAQKTNCDVHFLYLMLVIYVTYSFK